MAPAPEAGPPHPWLRLGAPVAAALLLVGALALHLGPRAALLVGLLVAYLIPPLSKETVLPLAVAAGFEPWLVAVAFTSTDLILAALVAWNWEALYRVPWLGARLTRLQAFVEARTGPWRNARRARLAAVFVFMAVPLIGSGAATASLLGRALGEHARRVFLAVALGAAVLNTAYAFFAAEVLRAGGLLGLAGGILVIVLLALAVGRLLPKRGSAGSS